jgi:predicted transcriptional regulator
MPSKTVSVRLTPETLTKLYTLAEARQRPCAWLIAHAIERYVDTDAWQVAAIQQAGRNWHREKLT